MRYPHLRATARSRARRRRVPAYLLPAWVPAPSIGMVRRVAPGCWAPRLTRAALALLAGSHTYVSKRIVNAWPLAPVAGTCHSSGLYVSASTVSVVSGAEDTIRIAAPPATVTR